ncbi:MAG: hypothetical protein OXT67_04290, partial [Zetaproteobacteria bacterium]|nr:hypothetical protein [Zetaproteobacteria bacterium]
MKNKIICIVADNFELDAIHLVHQWASSNYEMTYLLPTEDPSQHLKNCKVSHTALYGHLKSFYLSKDFDLSEISLTLSTYEAIIFVGISTTFSFTFWNVAELSTIPKMVWITEKKADRLHLHQNTRQYLHSIVRTSQKIFVTHPNVQSFLSGIEEKQIPIILPIHTRNIVFFDELQRQQIRQNNKYTCTNVVIFAESSSDDFTYLSFCLESFYLFWIKNPQSKLILHGPCATNPVLNYMIQSLGCQEAVKTVTSITHAEKPPYYSASDLAVVYNEPSSADSPILFDGSVYQYYTNGLPLMVHEDSLHEYSDSLNQDMIHTFTANHVSLAQCFFKLTQALPHHCRNKQAQAFQSQVYQAIKTGGHMFVKELQSVVSVPSQEVLDHKRLHHDNVFSWIQIMEDSELESNPFNTDQETELIHFIESKNAHNLSHKILCAAGIVYMTQSRFD